MRWFVAHLQALLRVTGWQAQRLQQQERELEQVKRRVQALRSDAQVMQRGR